MKEEDRSKFSMRAGLPPEKIEKGLGDGSLEFQETKRILERRELLPAQRKHLAHPPKA